MFVFHIIIQLPAEQVADKEHFIFDTHFFIKHCRNYYSYNKTASVGVVRRRGQHPHFIFGRSQVWNSTQRSAILAEDFMVFLISLRQIMSLFK